jgi:hypothetical protein
MQLSMPRLLLSSILLSSILALTPPTASSVNPHASLDDLKKLEILCYVPAWLPKGFKLTSVTITYDEPGPDETGAGRFPLYQYEYVGLPRGGIQTTFTVDCAREGIGDRNLLETEDSEEITITSPFGPMYLIYTPKGKGKSSRKVEIKANWAEDPHMKAEKSKDRLAHPVLGRYHGFSATGITVAEFEKIITSLKPVHP